MKANVLKRRKVTLKKKTNNEADPEVIQNTTSEENEVENNEAIDNSMPVKKEEKVTKRKITLARPNSTQNTSSQPQPQQDQDNTKKVQPWDLWEYIYNPWDADIIKRISKAKIESKLVDLKKIKQIALKRIDLIKNGYIAISGKKCPTNTIKTFCVERNLSDFEIEIVAAIMIGDTNSILNFKYIIELVDKIIQEIINNSQNQ